MTELQLLQAIKVLAIARVWSGGTVVFPTGCVAITGNVDLAMEAALGTMRTPLLLLQPLDSVSDPEAGEDPNFVTLNINARIVVMVPGDAVGENALLGANKTGGATASEGRGIFEVEQELFTCIGRLNDNESIQLQCTYKGGVNAAIVDGRVYVAYRDFKFEALGTMV